MIITLKTLLQHTFTIDVDENLTIKELKRRVNEERGADFPAESLNLIYSGAIMKDEEQIKDYKIDIKKFIVVMKKKEKVDPPAATSTSTSTSKAPVSSAADQSAVSSPASSAAAKQEGDGTAAAAKKPEASGPSSEESSSQSDNEEVIRNMMELGYSRQLVEAALRLSYNNPNVACEFLISERVTEANMNTVEADGLALGAAREDLMELVEAFDNSRNQAGSNPENEPLAFLRAQPQFHQMRQQIQENPQFLQTVLQQIGVNNPGLLKLISENQSAFVNMINEPLNNNNNNNNNTNNNRNITSSGSSPSVTAAQPIAADAMEVQESRPAAHDLTANDDLLAATLASQLAEDEEEEEAEGQQHPAAADVAAQPPQHAEGSGFLESLPPLTDSDRAAIRRIVEMSGFSEIEVIQAYIVCGKNEDLAANFLFME